MKYKTQPNKKQTRESFNAWEIATKGGELSRVSVSHYYKARRAAFWLGWLNDYADKLADFDNDPARYTPEKSAKYAERLQHLETRTAEALHPLGVEFVIYSHFYHIKSKKTGKEIYIKL